MGGDGSFDMMGDDGSFDKAISTRNEGGLKKWSNNIKLQLIFEVYYKFLSFS